MSQPTPAAALNPYARFLAPDAASLETVLAASPSALAEIVEALGPDRISVSPAPGKWSPAQVLCHLADCELAFAFRLRQTLAEEHHVLQPFDQDRWATHYDKIPANQALAAFTAMREWNLILIRQALSTAAAKPVTHPERGSMTFLTLVETMAGHDLNHITQLKKLV